jgi:hypothetical protein
MRPPCTLLIEEDAFAHASYFIDELNSRYDLRIFKCPLACLRAAGLVLRGVFC